MLPVLYLVQTLSQWSDLKAKFPGSVAKKLVTLNENKLTPVIASLIPHTAQLVYLPFLCTTLHSIFVRALVLTITEEKYQSWQPQQLWPKRRVELGGELVSRGVENPDFTVQRGVKLTGDTSLVTLWKCAQGSWTMGEVSVQVWIFWRSK